MNAFLHTKTWGYLAQKVSEMECPQTNIFAESPVERRSVYQRAWKARADYVRAGG
jgi:hypothetical protein